MRLPLTAVLGILLTYHPALNAVLTEKSASIRPEVAANEQINWHVLSGGGTRGSSTNYQLNGTLGQTAIGPAQSTSYNINQGFWQNFSISESCCNLPGDANNSDVRNILDVTYVIAFLYKGGPPHPDCHPDEMDANGNGIVNILDVTFMITFLYKGGPVPICP